VQQFNVIDLFAGPGGLSEGFSGYSKDNFNPFKVSISIEMDACAHKTLSLRSFFRQFENAPKEYYQCTSSEYFGHSA
tara:strand:+ start:356 stop:586 length:231 start_codon:yes stop_codon:yes gene_type:complete